MYRYLSPHQPTSISPGPAHISSSCSYFGDNWPQYFWEKLETSKQLLRERYSRKLVCIRVIHSLEILGDGIGIGPGGCGLIEFSVWLNLNSYIDTTELWMCLRTEKPLVNLRSSHSFLDSDLEKMLVDTPWCNRVWYFRRYRWGKFTSVPGEEMGTRESRPHVW